MGEQNKPQEGKPLTAEEMYNETSLFGVHDEVISLMEVFAAQETAALREELEEQKRLTQKAKDGQDMANSACERRGKELEAVKKERDDLFKVINDLQSSYKGAMNDKIIFEKGFNAAKEATDNSLGYLKICQEELIKVTRQRDECKDILIEIKESAIIHETTDRAITNLLSRISSGETKRRGYCTEKCIWERTEDGAICKKCGAKTPF